MIYSDMDGVLVDFEKGYKERVGMGIKEMDLMFGGDDGNRDMVWGKTRCGVFWEQLPKMPECDELLDMYYELVEPEDLGVLTAPVRCDPTCKPQKMKWIVRETLIEPDNFLCVKRSLKRNFALDENGHPNILVDDLEENIEEWNAAGGLGILHTNIYKTVKQFKETLGEYNAKRFVRRA